MNSNKEMFYKACEEFHYHIGPMFREVVKSQLRIKFTLTLDDGKEQPWAHFCTIGKEEVTQLEEESWAFMLKSLYDYKYFHSKGLVPPDQVYIKTWMENIERQVADKRGEFIPSNSQFAERLKSPEYEEALKEAPLLKDFIYKLRWQH